ncbi:MAG: alpha/beta hydrolase [Actinomycetota bacterium]|nr:alpha/beta hydrolase [Actinomycetota bacterium]
MTASTVTTHESVWSLAAPWGGKGYVTDLDGPVHWIDFGGPADATPVVFVHGLGGSHLNWALIGQTLAEGRRAVALDLRGFGFTQGTRQTTTVHANGRLLERFLCEVIGTPVVLVGNSMGGMVSVLHTHAAPDTVAGLVLVDPALPVPKRLPDPGVAATFLVYAVPGVGEYSMRAMQARLSPAEVVDRIVSLCFADPTRANPRMLAAGADLVEARRPIARKEESFLGAARSLMRVLVKPDRYVEKLHGIDKPVLLIHGEEDRLVPIAAARRAAAANPAWETAFLPGVGHTPQLEVPTQTSDIIAEWLARVPSLPKG